MKDTWKDGEEEKMRSRSGEFLFDDILHRLLFAHNASDIIVTSQWCHTAKYLASSMLLHQAHTIQKHLTCITFLFWQSTILIKMKSRFWIWKSSKMWFLNSDILGVTRQDRNLNPIKTHFTVNRRLWLTRFRHFGTPEHHGNLQSPPLLHGQCPRRFYTAVTPPHGHQMYAGPSLPWHPHSH